MGCYYSTEEGPTGSDLFVEIINEAAPLNEEVFDEFMHINIEYPAKH